MGSPRRGPTQQPPSLGVRVLARYPHDIHAFTQGLHHEGAGVLLESTGNYGKSSVRRVALHSGDVMLLKPLRDDWFGEGLAVIGETVLQLLWKTPFILRYSLLMAEITWTGTGTVS